MPHRPPTQGWFNVVPTRLPDGPGLPRDRWRRVYRQSRYARRLLLATIDMNVIKDAIVQSMLYGTGTVEVRWDA